MSRDKNERVPWMERGKEAETWAKAIFGGTDCLRGIGVAVRRESRDKKMIKKEKEKKEERNCWKNIYIWPW